jgi:hypothetical protein
MTDDRTSRADRAPTVTLGPHVHPDQVDGDAIEPRERRHSADIELPSGVERASERLGRQLLRELITHAPSQIPIDAGRVPIEDLLKSLRAIS